MIDFSVVIHNDRHLRLVYLIVAFKVQNVFQICLRPFLCELLWPWNINQMYPLLFKVTIVYLVLGICVFNVSYLLTKLVVLRHWFQRWP